MSKTIVLIGPMSAGKSTVAQELAKLTKLPRTPMDSVRWYYYLKDGYSFEKDAAIESFDKRIEYWKPFEVKAVKRILAEFPDTIIDFGAGHSHYTHTEQRQEVEQAMAQLKNVFLLLPSVDSEESIKICNERLKQRVKRDLDQTEIEANIEFVKSESNFSLAKHIIYTKDKTPQETAKEIQKLLQ